ncbi:MAG: NADH-quinone oxidoreductase subunit J [Ancrocorticia populi]|uniref:NADH-quinone oxidoreductase subunit J n=1 Tax=Ancrocorticia populi TaxID=2175228 RepID=UPI003F92AC29
MMGTLEISTGETLLFFAIAIVMIVLAIFGLLITRRAVYSAGSMIAIMVCLAFLYTMLEAPFMGVVQVAVYTGAILMMFLFVLMMIGVDSSDTTHETLNWQRPVAVLGGLGFVVIAIGAILGAHTPEAVGMKEANSPTNPESIAQSIFGNHVLTLELVGTLLVVAALGAMVLTHREKTHPELTQPELVDAKMEAYAATGRHIGQKPPTGVYAESNSAANPALTAGGVEVEESVPRVLRVRGQARRVSQISPATADRIRRGELDGPHPQVPDSGLPGMPGEAAPEYPSSAPQIDSAPDKPELEEGESE